MYTNPDIPPSYEVSLQAKLNDANQEIGALTERLAAAEQSGYERALDDAQTVIDAEYDRWLDDKDEEYPDFGIIHEELDRLRAEKETMLFFLEWQRMAKRQATNG